MSGILDSKSRILDAILTIEGRRQMAGGTFNVSYVTFDDVGVSYVPDPVDGHADPTTKIYLEACNLPQDQIVFESNDEGSLVPLRVQSTYINNPGGNVSSSYSLASIKDGKMLVRELFHGRRVKMSNIDEVHTDLGRGFGYSDSTGLTGSILIDPFMNGGQVTISTPVGGPYVGKVGTKSGLVQTAFAQKISDVINGIAAGGGPAVKANAQDNFVFLDAASSVVGDKFQLFYTGTLSSPLVLEESVAGGRSLADEIQNQLFASQIPGILSSSFDNFLDLGVIASVDKQLEDDTFVVDKPEVRFNVEKINRTKVRSLCSAPPTVDSIDSLFNDDKLSHLENFMYLPPILKNTLPQVAVELSKEVPVMSNVSSYMLGDYPSWGDNEKKLTLTKLGDQLKEFESTDILFTETSSKNNVIAQFFEVSNSTVTKLDVVDFGELKTNTTDDPYGPTRRVFFVGKVYIDSRGATCFVNMFTLIFSNTRREQS